MSPYELAGRFGLGRLSPRDRRAIRLGLIILLPALLWAGVVRPYRRAWSETRDRLQAERALLARERGLIASASTLPNAALEAASQAGQARRRMIEAANPALAEEVLTGALERMAAESRVLLEEMRGVEPPRSADRPAGIQPVRLAVRGRSDLNGVTAFLRRVEEHRLLLRVEELSLQPVTERPANDERGRTQEAPLAEVSTGAIEFALIVEAWAAAGSFGGAVAKEEVGT